MHFHPLKQRFRGFMPVIIDIETAGFNAETDALLELAAVTVDIDCQGNLSPAEVLSYHIEPFKNANLDQSALEFTGIDPHHPFRFAISEKAVLNDLFGKINVALKRHHCQRAVMVAHNAWFDLSFFRAAVARCKFNKTPFHGFTSFDTASLSGLMLGQTVLARALACAKIPFNDEEAHSAIYDAERTAELFCYLCNRFRAMFSLENPNH